MFGNRITSRDLLKQQSNQERHRQSEFSQLQNAQFTQFDLSQDYSQDRYSQDDLSVRTEPLSRRPSSTLDKYLSGNHERASLYKPVGALLSAGRQGSQDSSQTFKPGGGHSFQQMLSSQKSRPKATDDRDVLNNVISFIKDCHEEVKQGLSQIKESDENACENLRQTMLDSLGKSTSHILKLLESQHNEKKDFDVMNRELRQRDEQIKELLQESLGKREEKHQRDEACLVESIKSVLQEHQNKAEEKMQLMVNDMKGILQHSLEDSIALMASEQDNNQRGLDVKHSKLYAQVQDVEKGLVHGLQSVKETFRGQLKYMEATFLNKLQTLQSLQENTDTSDHQLFQDLQERLQQLCNSVGEPGKLISELQDISRTQKAQIEKYIKSQTADQTKQILKQTQDSQNKQHKQHKDFQRSLEQQLESMRSEQELFMSDVKSCLEDIKASSASLQEHIANDNIVKQLQEQLLKYERAHKAELKRLESKLDARKDKTSLQNQQQSFGTLEHGKTDQNSKINHSGKTKTPVLGTTVDFKETEMDATGDYKGVSKQQFKLRDKVEHVAYCPPQKNWPNQPLCERTKPSPFATVFPQRQQSNASLSSQSMHQSKQGNQVVVQPLQKPTLRVQAEASQVCSTRMELRRRPNSQQNENGRHIAGHEQNYLVNNNLKSSKVDMDNGFEFFGSPVNESQPKANQSTQKKQKKPRKKKGRKCASYTKARKQTNYDDQTLGQEPGNLKTQALVETEARCGPVQPYARKNQVQTLATKQASRNDVYDFDKEERECSSIFKKPNIGNVGPVVQYQPNRSHCTSSDDHEQSDADSCRSSPSIAVSDLLIRRVVACERRSPERTGTMTSDAAAMSYLLNSSGLGDICSGVRQNSEHVQVRPEKRRLLDSGVVMYEMMQQKMRRLF